MSVAVCRSSEASGFESILALPAALSASSNTRTETERPPGELDIWASSQAQKDMVKKEQPYVHPLMRRSSSLLSQKSLQICTESLGSESGSDDYFSFSDNNDSNVFTNSKQIEVENEEMGHAEKRMKRNYRCCTTSRASERRCFPPPLPSISRRDGSCLKMQPLRRNGRLVVEAVAVPSQNFLHAERQNGRLLLSFANANTTSHNSSLDEGIERNNATEGIIDQQVAQTEEEEEEEEDQEEEEEVQVVDRGTVVEVNVSTKPPQQNKTKVHRSSIVINKFVSFTPNIDNEKNYTIAAAVPPPPPSSMVRRLSTTATTAAAAVVAASSLSASAAGDVSDSSVAAEKKLLLTCSSSRRRRNKEELLHEMRRCGQLRRPLFFREPCCVATSS